MTDTRSPAPDRRPDQRGRAVDRLFDVYRTVFWVYGGFLIGILSYAWWAGDDLVFWPWSLVYLILLTGLVVWARRRSTGTASAESITRHHDSLTG